MMIVALTCLLLAGAAATTILGRDSVPAAKADMASPVVKSPVANREGKQDRLAVATAALASFEPPDRSARRRGANRSGSRRSAAVEIGGDAAVVPVARRSEAGSAHARPPDRFGESRGPDLDRAAVSNHAAAAQYPSRCLRPSLRGNVATKQSSFLSGAKMDCFADARNDVVLIARRANHSLLDSPVQPHSQKYLAFAVGQIKSTTRAVLLRTRGV